MVQIPPPHSTSLPQQGLLASELGSENGPYKLVALQIASSLPACEISQYLTLGKIEKGNPYMVSGSWQETVRARQQATQDS